MSTQLQQYDSNPPNFPLYEELKEKIKEIPSSLSPAQMRRIITNKYIAFRIDRKQCANLCIITYIIILRFYDGRHEEVDLPTLLSIYKGKVNSKGVRFELENLPDRLVKMIYVLVDSIKGKE